MKRKSIFYGLLAIWSICWYGSSRCHADNAKAPRLQANVPFTLGSDGRMYVQAKINGQVQATFLIDSGIDVNYISSAIQDKLRMPLHRVTVDGKPESKPFIMDGKELMAIIPASVLMGGLNLTTTAFILQAAKKLPEAPVPSGHVDGVIGSRVLDQFAILLDFRGNRMVMWYPSGLTKPEMKALNFTILYTVPISPSPYNPDIWMAHVQFSNGKAAAEQDMMIDTGASITTIPSQTADQLKIAGNGMGTATVFLNKKVSVMTGQVTQMQMGDFVLLSHTVWYPERAASNYPVSVGMDIFRGYASLIDFGQKTMYLGFVGMGVSTTPKK